jgi:hypothetical protein
MAEKGETKIVVIVSIIIILLSISFSGCFEEEKEDESYSLNVTIYNLSEHSHKIDIIIENSKNLTIFNNSCNLKPDEYKHFKDITSKKEEYTTKIILDDGRSEIFPKIELDKMHHSMGIYFNNTEIWGKFTVS